MRAVSDDEERGGFGFWGAQSSRHYLPLCRLADSLSVDELASGLTDCLSVD